jgi:hypothetical protein
VGTGEALRLAIGEADVLTGEATGDAVDKPSPWATVKGLDIIKDRKEGDRTVRLPTHEDLPTIEITLDCADRGMPHEDVGKYPSASACK